VLNPGSGASIKEIDEWSGTCKTTDISRCGVGDDRVAAAVCRTECETGGPPSQLVQADATVSTR